MMSNQNTPVKIGLAGYGALGRVVANALLDSKQSYHQNYELVGISEIADTVLPVTKMDFETLALQCDLIIECLPSSQVGALLKCVKKAGKDMIMISGAALLIEPELYEMATSGQGRVMLPAGALAGLDGVWALKAAGADMIQSATITTTKHPHGLSAAPYVQNNQIDLKNLVAPKIIFEGTARDAAAAFPANVNVAATLSMAGLGPDKTRVRVCADPAAQYNSHEIEVIAKTTTIKCKIENRPDPANPKSSTQAAYSILAVLDKLSARLSVI
jgi:aspartate dehydrogenase